VPALEEFFGSSAGLSASVITRLTTECRRNATFAHRALRDVDYVYVFADGSNSTSAGRGTAVCPVVVGVRSDGTKELVSISDGHRGRSSPGLTCCGLKRRGMTARAGCR